LFSQDFNKAKETKIILQQLLSMAKRDALYKKKLLFAVAWSSSVWGLVQLQGALLYVEYH